MHLARGNMRHRTAASTTLVALAAAAAASAAAAAPAFPPCYAAIDDPLPHLDVLLIESPCFTPIYDYQDTDALRITLRAYPAAAAAAWVVEASIDDDPGNTFADNLRLVGNYVFDYFGGGNSEILNVSNALTAPFSIRPPVEGRSTWVGAMALAPSLWPAAKTPPSSIIPKIVDVRPIGGVVVAALPMSLPRAPTEDDFRSAYKTLELYVSVLPLPAGHWTINASSPLSPTFSFYYKQTFNGSNFQIEVSAEVYFLSD
jgi:hypothetical protein